MSYKQFLYAIVSLVLLMHTVAAAPGAVQSPGTTVAQELVKAAANAGYSIDPSQVQTVTLPNGGSVANYALVTNVDASNLPEGGVTVALQYWASSDLTGFVVVNLTGVSKQALQFTLSDSKSNVVGTQTVPTAAAEANQKDVRRAVIIRVTICVTAWGVTVCVSWTVVIATAVVRAPAGPPPKLPVNGAQVAAN